ENKKDSPRMGEIARMKSIHSWDRAGERVPIKPVYRVLVNSSPWKLNADALCGLDSRFFCPV
ncbi:MAG: hypothetical protein LBP23_06860, partial [Treponema sp.]|nr:hypothetical protein [Treponema sp.]